MKSAVFLLAAALAAVTASGQSESRFAYSTALGVGIALNEPASTPFVWRAAGYYKISARFWTGAGTGISRYEKTLIPLYAEARLLLLRPRRFTPYAGCAAGYAFAPQKEAKGGFLLSPAVGVQYALRGGRRIFVAAGYELQKLERLRRYDGPYFSAQFAEKLSHGSLLLQIGFQF